jgi:hypothetical protein
VPDTQAQNCSTNTLLDGAFQHAKREAEALFEIRDAPWQLASIEKLASHERPDPAFRLLCPVDCGLLTSVGLKKTRRPSLRISLAVA